MDVVTVTGCLSTGFFMIFISLILTFYRTRDSKDLGWVLWYAFVFTIIFICFMLALIKTFLLGR